MGPWEAGHPSSAPAWTPGRGQGPQGTGHTSVEQGSRLAVPAHVIPENHLTFPRFSEAPLTTLFFKKNFTET